MSDTNAKQELDSRCTKDALVKTLPFDSETRAPQDDVVSRKVYIDLRTVNQVAAVDGCWRLPREPHRIREIAVETRRVSCRASSMKAGEPKSIVA